ncbi:MAG: PKD domain-containing protein [Nevskia sp.]|nr:PKD domain-containing protein [Nevskia sp.]
MTLASILPIAVVLALLAGCDGDAPGTSAPPPPVPPPAGNRAPVAQFAAPGAVVAGQPLAFDGSASSDPDGDAISLHWDFGDGLRGGGGRLAHVFDSAGSYPVTLTATDAAGASGSTQQMITVAAAPVPARTQSVSGRVTALDGSALAEVSVRADAAIGEPQTLRFSRSGYVDQVQTLNFPEGSGDDTSFVVAMRASEPAQTLADADADADAAAGGVLSGRDGVRIQLPPAALITADGVPVTGAVDITMTPIDITRPNAGGFPGQFAGIDANAVVQPIVSYGTTDFVLSQGGQRLQLAPGKPAEILLPLYATQRLGGAVIAVGERMPLWSLSETSGLWVQEGEGEVVAAAAAPTGLALRATVSHFSPWNADIPFVLRSPGVRGRCVYDDIGVPGARDHFATAVLCNWLAEMDRGIPPQGAAGSAARGAPARAPARFGSQAEPPAPPLPGFSATGAVPVGGDLLPLPANAPIRFTVTALNGSFTGSATLAADSTASEVVVKMRPLETGGGDGEAITLPFEAERRFEAGETQSFRLDGQGFRWLRVTVTPTGSGAPVQGEIRVFRGLLPVAGGSLQSGLTVLLAANGEHRVELLPTGNTSATARLRIELLGSDQAETLPLPLPLPLDLFRGQPELTVLRSSFNVEAARSLHFGLRENGVHYRLRAPDGSEVFNFPADGNGSSFSFLQHSLPASVGNYLLEAASINGLAWPLNLSAELSHWLPQGAVLDGYRLLDLVADRDGQPVLLLSRGYSEGGSARQALALRRWSGSEWLEAAAELAGIVPRNCGFSAANAASLAFDSGNRPLLAYTEALGSAGIRTVVQRYSGSAWQTVGPNDGVLSQNPGRASCTTARVLIRVDGDDRPLVALRSAQSDFQLEVSRYDGNAWAG